MGCVLGERPVKSVTVTDSTQAPSSNDTAPTPKDRRRLPPPGVEFPKTIKSYVRRAGRTTSGQAKAFEELGPRFVLPYTPNNASAARQGTSMRSGKSTSPICRLGPI